MALYTLFGGPFDGEVLDSANPPEVLAQRLLYLRENAGRHIARYEMNKVNGEWRYEFRDLINPENARATDTAAR